MTVGELKDILSKLPDGVKVCVDGYEDGYDDVSDVNMTSIHKDPSPESWEGKYQNSLDDDSFKALVLSRSNK